MEITQSEQENLKNYNSLKDLCNAFFNGLLKEWNGIIPII